MISEQKLKQLELGGERFMSKDGIVVLFTLITTVIITIIPVIFCILINNDIDREESDREQMEYLRKYREEKETAENERERKLEEIRESIKL